MPTATKDDRRGARERLLEAASRLFYAEGVHTVGVDRIIEEAGVAKASLYKTFGSKDALVQAYLTGRHERTTGRIVAALALVDDPREKILTLYDVQATMFVEPGYRGCAFVAAASESAPGDTAEEAAAVYRGWMRALFVDLAEQVGASEPRVLGRQLHLLWDGASLSARMERDWSVAADARAAAAALVAAAQAR